MLKVIKMISEAKKTKSIYKPIIVDLHPDRPEYRGFMIGNNPSHSQQILPLLK